MPDSIFTLERDKLGDVALGEWLTHEEGEWMRLNLTRKLVMSAEPDLKSFYWKAFEYIQVFGM